jgi:hypothetical protein
MTTDEDFTRHLRERIDVVGPVIAVDTSRVIRGARRHRAIVRSGAVSMAVTAVALVGWVAAAQPWTTGTGYEPAEPVPTTTHSASTATAEPAPSASPTPEPTVTQTTAPPVAPPTPGISPIGIGPVRLGMTFAEVSAATGAQLPERCPAMTAGAVAGVDVLWMTSDPDAPGVVDALYAFWYPFLGNDVSAGPRTAAGIGLGSSEEELLSAYPTAVRAPGDSGSDWVVDLEGTPLAIDIGEDGAVVELGLGTSVLPLEFCG